MSEFSDVVIFDIGSILQGQTRIAKLKSAYNSLIFVLEVWDGKPTNGKSWARNLMVWSDLTWAPPSRPNKDSETLKCL